jgi:hypothetical protein
MRACIVAPGENFRGEAVILLVLVIACCIVTGIGLAVRVVDS